LNFLNLFDQDTVTGIYPTLNPSSAPANPANLGLNRIQYGNTYTDGTQLALIRTFLGGAPDRTDIRYKMPQLFQAPRVGRFGFRFLF
jgi:hypothetical protein